MDDMMAEKQDNRTEGCEPIQALLAAYALGDRPLDAPTRAHLLVCSACQKTLREYRGIVQMLPYAAPDATPPSLALRERLIATVQAEVVQSSASSRLNVTPASPAPHQGLRFRSRFRGWAAFGAALIAIVVLLGWNISLQQQLTTQTASLTASREGWQTLVVMMNDPTVVSYRMSGEVARGTVWGVPQREIACLMLEDLPAPPSGQVYQVWLSTSTGWSSAGTFESRPGNRWFILHPAQVFSSYTAVLVTAEPAGGSQSPTGPALIQGDLAVRT